MISLAGAQLTQRSCDPLQHQTSSGNWPAVVPACNPQALQSHLVCNNSGIDQFGPPYEQQGSPQRLQRPMQRQVQHYSTVTPEPAASSVAIQPEHIPGCFQQALGAQLQHTAAAMPGSSPAAATAACTPAGPLSAQCISQQQLQQSPGSSLDTSASLIPQSSTLTQSLGSTGSLAPSNASGDFLSSIVTSIESEVTKVIRPLINQAIQQEVQKQIAQLSGGIIRQQIMQQVQQLVSTQQQQGAVPPAAADSQLAAVESPATAAAAAAAMHGSTRVQGCSLATSASSDPASIGHLVAASCTLIQQQQQEQQQHVGLVSYPSSCSLASQQQQQRSGTPVSNCSSDFALPVAQGPSVCAGQQQQQQQQQHEPLAAALAALGPLQQSSIGPSGHYTGGTARGTVHPNSSKVTPFQNFARPAGQPVVATLLHAQQQQQQAVTLPVPAPQPLVPAACFPQVPDQQSLQVPPTSVPLGRDQEELVQSPGVTSDTAAAAASDNAASIWQCAVNDQAMRELLAHCELVGGTSSDPGSVSGTSGDHFPGPISGNIFDEIDGLADFLAEDGLGDLSDLPTPPPAAAAANQFAAHQLQQQQQQSVCKVDVVLSQHSTPAQQHTAVMAAAPRKISCSGSSSKSTAAAAAAAARPAPARPAAAAAAAAAAATPRKRNREPAAKHTKSPNKKRTISKNTNHGSAARDASVPQQQQQLKQQRQLQIHQQLYLQQQRQQQQRSQAGGLISQLPTWLAKQVLP